MDRDWARRETREGMHIMASLAPGTNPLGILNKANPRVPIANFTILARPRSPTLVKQRLAQYQLAWEMKRKAKAALDLTRGT